MKSNEGFPLRRVGQYKAVVDPSGLECFSISGRKRYERRIPMRQIESSNSAENKHYYGPAPMPPQQPRSEQYYYGPATMPPQQMQSEQLYGSASAPQGSWPYYQPAPGVAQPRAAQHPSAQPQPARKTYTPNPSKVQVRQRISTYKRRIVALAFAAFGTLALVTGLSIHQSSSASTSSSSTSSNTSSSSDDSSSSNFFNQGGSSNVGSSSQPSSSGTTNS